jgi:hypothetical protein
MQHLPSEVLPERTNAETPVATTRSCSLQVKTTSDRRVQQQQQQQQQRRNNNNSNSITISINNSQQRKRVVHFTGGPHQTAGETC